MQISTSRVFGLAALALLLLCAVPSVGQAAPFGGVRARAQSLRKTAVTRFKGWYEKKKIDWRIDQDSTLRAMRDAERLKHEPGKAEIAAQAEVDRHGKHLLYFGIASTAVGMLVGPGIGGPIAMFGILGASIYKAPKIAKSAYRVHQYRSAREDKVRETIMRSREYQAKYGRVEHAHARVDHIVPAGAF
jgi:hypothetical protein